MTWGLPLLAAMALAGCATTAPATALAAPLRVASVETASGLAFAPLSEAHVAMMRDRVTTTARNPAIPAVSNALDGGDRQTLLLGGRPFERASAVAALAPGHAGAGADPIAGVVKPLVAGWATDAALVRDYRYPARGWSDGVPPANWTANELAVVNTFGWPLAYRSASRGEDLLVYVGADSTLVVRVRRGEWP
ncbi:hypothetical protein D3C72_771750 [compost metagenome]